jgi:hypothetical protein
MRAVRPSRAPCVHLAVAGVPLVLGGAGVSSAMGQTQGTATWVWSVWDVGEHADGDLIIEPGEDVAVGLWLDFSPDVDGPAGPVIGFGAALWDVLGGLNAATGWISEWEINKFIDSIACPTTDGVSILDAGGYQPVGYPFFDYSDPIWIMDFIWRTDDFTPRTVEYLTRTLYDLVGVWYRTPDNKYLGVAWDAVEAHVSWHIVPPPGVLLMLAGSSAWLVLRRRRR